MCCGSGLVASTVLDEYQLKTTGGGARQSSGRLKVLPWGIGSWRTTSREKTESRTKVDGSTACWKQRAFECPADCRSGGNGRRLDLTPGKENGRFFSAFFFADMAFVLVVTDLDRKDATRL